MKNLINRIIDRISAIPSDKWAHFVIGMALVMLFSKISFTDYPYNVIGAFGTTLVMMIGKEIYDAEHREGFDWKDILAGLAGTALGAFMVII